MVGDQWSAMVPGVALRLVVRYFGSRAPGIFSGSKPAGRSSAQWSRFGRRVPLPSAALQPIDTPCGWSAPLCQQRESVAAHRTAGLAFVVRARAFRTWLNQKQDCPAAQTSVPLLQWQVYGSISPVSGNLPSALHKNATRARSCQRARWSLSDKRSGRDMGGGRVSQHGGAQSGKRPGDSGWRG